MEPTLKETINAKHIEDMINKHAQKYCSLAFLSIITKQKEEVQ